MSSRNLATDATRDIDSGSTNKDQSRSNLGTANVFVTTLLAIWVAAIAIRGAVFPLQLFDLPLAWERPRNFATEAMVGIAAAIAVLTLVVAVICRITIPRLSLVVPLFVSGCIVSVVAAVTGSLSSLFVVVVLFVSAGIVGQAIVRVLVDSRASPELLGPISVALGLGIYGLAFLGLGAISSIGAVTIAVTVLVLTGLAVAIDRDRLRQTTRQVRLWQPAVPTWFETLVAALATSLVTFALLTALVPEMQTDATREHLPIAREIWQSGSVAVFEPLRVSQDPVLGHLLYAAAFGFGGPTAATLVHTAVGLVAIWGIATIGTMVSGRTAAIAAAAIFATMPIVLWELGHAFLDLFPVLYAVTAACCILRWQHDGNKRWLLLAGALTGFGFAAKVTMAWSTVGLLAGVLLVGRQPAQWRDRIVAGVVFALGNLVIVPWLIRGLILNGTLPGISYAQSLLARVSPDLANAIARTTPTPPPFILDSAAQETTQTYLASRGLGHSPIDLLQSPWAMTFHADQLQFPIIGRGEVGIALLMLLPLALLGPRTRGTALLAIGAIVAFLIWFSTPYQIVRHLLPTLGLLSALAGIGVAAVIARAAKAPTRILAAVSRVGLVAALVIVPFLLLPSARASLPTDYVLGRESSRAYLARVVPSALVLQASSELLPSDTPVAYIGGVWEGPQIYTEARLVYIVPALLGASAEEILGNLDLLDLRYLIWNRQDSTDQDWRAPALSSPFLENHARILAGADDAYLLEIVPEGVAPWGSQSPGDLLLDPEFKSIRKGNGPWIATERAAVNDGQVTLRRRASLSQEAEVQGGESYVLTAFGSCADPGDQVTLGLQWLGSDGSPIASHSERVLPGQEPNDQFIWRTAPDAAARVVVSVGAIGSATCDFSRIALHQVD